MKIISNRTGGFLPALILAVMLVLGLSAQKAQAQDYYDDYGNGDYQEFYDGLSPYGQWFNDPQYGYVWMPNAGSDFRPYYTNGQWVMTEYGNTWVSNYAWGWAPFHYGRWAQGMYGWVWIPGNEWGPAWVNWRQGGGYYGWAPMGPGVSINISFGSGFNVPNPWWTFIPCGNIYSPGWQNYYSPRRTVNIINNTTIINNTYVDNRTRSRYVAGPRRSDIEAVTRQRVNVYNVSNRTRSGATNISGRTVNVYRPNIERTSGRGQTVSAPRQARTLERSAITNTGGGRPPSRAAVQRNNTGVDRSGQLRNAQERNQQAVPQRGIQNERVQQQRSQQADIQRNNAQMQRPQRDQQMQQQRVQRDQQMQQQRMQRDQQMQQQRMQEQQQRVQRDQQMQQQRMQEQQQQRVQRDQQMQQQRMQRDQQMQQQRMQEQQQQRVQRDQQMQQQRMQRDQQMQQRQIERQPAPQQRMERSAPAPQPQRMERSAPAPQQRNVERGAPRGR
jgi:hypothetical protein